MLCEHILFSLDKNSWKCTFIAKHDKDVDVLTYRDATVTSKFTKTKSPKHHTNFMLALGTIHILRKHF